MCSCVLNTVKCKGTKCMDNKRKDKTLYLLLLILINSIRVNFS